MRTTTLTEKRLLFSNNNLEVQGGWLDSVGGDCYYLEITDKETLVVTFLKMGLSFVYLAAMSHCGGKMILCVEILDKQHDNTEKYEIRLYELSQENFLLKNSLNHKKTFEGRSVDFSPCDKMLVLSPSSSTSSFIEVYSIEKASLSLLAKHKTDYGYDFKCGKPVWSIDGKSFFITTPRWGYPSGSYLNKYDSDGRFFTELELDEEFIQVIAASKESTLYYCVTNYEEYFFTGEIISLRIRFPQEPKTAKEAIKLFGE